MKIFQCWLPLSSAIMSTNLLHDELECSPVVQHAHEEADEVYEGEGAEEEGDWHHPLVIDLPEDRPDGLGDAAVCAVVVLGHEGLPISEIGEHEGCPLV